MKSVTRVALFENLAMVCVDVSTGANAVFTACTTHDKSVTYSFGSACEFWLPKNYIINVCVTM